MARKDKIHSIVKNALEKDSWIVSDKPLIVEVVGENKNLEIDMEAEKVIVAEKGKTQIAVEIKSFLEPSVFHTFHKVLGQYLNYKDLLESNQKNHKLVVAIPDYAFAVIDQSPFLTGQFRKYQISAFVVDTKNETILQWIN
jgi:hypothetical protein